MAYIPQKISAGTLSSARTDVTFGDSNGISFGLNTNGVITGTVKTDYQTSGAYLTTAALSQDSSKYAGINGAITGGSITVNTSGVSINLPAYLTTAALSQDSSKYAGTNGAITGGSITVNTSGVSINLPAYLTTAMQSQSSSVFAKTGFTTTSITGTVIAGTHDTDGLKLAVPAYLTTAQPTGAYLTTAALSGDTSKYVQAWELTGNTAGTTSSLQGTKIYFEGGNSITVSGNSNTIKLSIGNYLTTAALSAQTSNFAGTNTSVLTIAGSDPTLTLNTTGLTLGYPKWLTTAALSGDTTKYAGVGESSGTVTGTDINFTMDTNGLSLLYPKYITTYVGQTVQPVAASGSNGSFNFSTLQFVTGNGASFYTDATGIRLSYTVPTVTNSVWTVSDANTSGTVGRLAFTNLNGITLSLSSGTGGLHTIVGSYTVPNVPAQTNQTLGLYMSSNTTSSVSSGTVDARSMTFRGVGVASVGYSGGEVIISVPAGGGAAIRGIAANGSTASESTVNFSNSNGISFGFGAAGNSTVITGSHNGITSQSNQPIYYSASNGLVNNSSTLKFVEGSGVTWATQAGGIQASVKTDYAQSWELEGNNTAGTTGSAQGATWYLSGGNNITLSGNSNTIIISAGAAGGAGTFSNFYQPFAMIDGTATSSGTLSQLNLQPFYLDKNQSFGQINMVGIATVVPTSASNSYSARLTNSTQGHSYQEGYSIGNTNFIDLFLFSRGSGSFSSELETFASTRNSFATNYNATWRVAATLTNTAGGSLLASQSVSVLISYPFVTSGQTINGATSHTTWGTGYTTWNSTASNSTSFTHSTSAARTLSCASTYPATVGWSGAKIIDFHFGTSLSAGEYWLGMVRYSSTSSASSTGSSVTGALGTGNSYSNTYNASALTQTAGLTIAGKTNTIVNSLGSLGFVTTNNMAPDFGLGSFSGTWASNTTYLNNAGNPAGAVAFTQILTGVSFFQSWFQMNSNRMV